VNLIKFKNNWALFKHYLSPHKKKLLQFAMFLSIVLVLQIFTPKILQIYIDTVQDPSTPIPGYIKTFLNIFPSKWNVLLSSGVIFIIFSLLQHMLNIISVYISQKLAWTATNQLRFDLTKHCMNLDMTFHNQNKPGEMIERIDGDVATLANFFSQFTVRLLASSLLITGVLIVLFLEHWVLGLVFTAFVILSFAILYFMRNISVRFWRKLRQTETEIMGYIEETLSGKEEIRANGLTPHVMNKYFAISRKMYNAQIKALVSNRFFRTVIWGLSSLCVILVFASGIPLFRDGDISIGTLFAVNIYTNLIRNLIFQIVQEIQNFQQTSACIMRIQELLNIETQVQDKGTKSFPETPITLTFDDVSFNYNEKETVLQNFSLDLSQNKSLGLIGQTGCGKTTVSRLIFRLYEPQMGQITVNGINIQDIPIRELRENISYVTQNIELFQATIRDNITFFDNSIPDEKILQVIDDLQLRSWFDNLPEGLNTKLNSGEGGLSAGESQLLALTRVFLKNPKIVILDEASSRIDPATEQLLNNAVNKLIKGRIAIIVAHRLSTLDKVDDIMILTKGSILEYDNRINLINNSNSIFNQYLEKGMQEVL
jgi:ABC-type multidrug transport system fused ATPase/permease subunit